MEEHAGCWFVDTEAPPGTSIKHVLLIDAAYGAPMHEYTLGQRMISLHDSGVRFEQWLVTPELDDLIGLDWQAGRL
ncbi:hypothetical protein N7508_001401 [Penicillium antarcticum]|uniref:uncharacterized protein n=1 Tax=Penicillium antarcticum TaxID=416450 RepID=UPI0023850EF3|nr:uncharacterized protein N7508_001401 [Penicillium antarcticum]KAJ5316893.1 hypothetical protein N7508_001401 [Penicillium antarcticum]